MYIKNYLTHPKNIKAKEILDEKLKNPIENY